MKVILFVLSFMSILNSIAQEISSKDIISKGYTFSNGSQARYNYGNDKGFIVLERIDKVSFDMAKSAINNEPFNYFSSLREYSSELKRKIFIEDNQDVYNLYLDTLNSIKKFYLNSFEYKTIHISKSEIGEYDLETKSFYSYYNFNRYMDELKMRLEKGQLFFDGNYYTGVPNIKQDIIKEGAYNELRTEFLIEDERIALDIENNGMDIVLCYNRLNNESDTIELRKVLVDVDGKLIFDWGEYRYIDSLIEVVTNEKYPNSITSQIESRTKRPTELDLPDSLKNMDNAVIENMAYYEGGEANYRRNSLIYPAQAVDMGIEGKVLAKFTVNEVGDVVDIMILESPNRLLSETVKSYLENMGKWVPATKKGKYVSSSFMIPFNFRLN